MSKVLITESYLEDIADAIRSKNGSSNTYKPSQMSTAISNLGGATLGTKNITSNNTYNASADNLDGYSSVTVNVPNPSTGTKQISINSNGTTTEDVTNYASAEISVNVPSGMSLEELYSQQKPSGDVTFTGSTMALTPLSGNSHITKFTAPSLTKVEASVLKSLSSLTYIVAQSVKDIAASGMNGNTSLLGIDVLGGGTWASLCLSGNTSLTTLVIRKTGSIQAASQSNMLNNSKSTSKPVHVYVPSALKSTYESATNWSTWKNDGTVVFHAIEGSAYETKYVDGTSIS